jgi:hypothetical protein
MARGRKTVGRQKGSRNRATEEARATAAAAKSMIEDLRSHLHPLPTATARQAKL